MTEIYHLSYNFTRNLSHNSGSGCQRLSAITACRKCRLALAALSVSDWAAFSAIPTSAKMQNMAKIIILILIVLTIQLKAQDEMSAANFRIDHLLIAVDNLDSAKKEYESYGFKVVYGGNERNALNALIFLKDGTAIELVGKDRFPVLYKVFNRLRLTLFFGIMKDRITTFPRVRAGFFNYSLFSDNLDSIYKYLSRNKIIVDEPRQFSRLRNDGVYINWKLVGTKPYDLPFIIGNYTPSRLSDSTFLEHENGAIAIDTIVIATISIEKYLNIYTLLYKAPIKIEAKNNTKTAYFKIDNITLELREVKAVNSFFKGDLSVTKSFSIKCKHTGGHSAIDLNEYIKLVR